MAYVSNPAVPYVGPIGTVQPGSIIQIAGHIPPHVKWFAINLQCGPNTNPRDDIALHINPRFEGNTSKVVRNSLQSQQWGAEENFGHFPFAPGQQFELLILAEPDHFKLAINGQHYNEFRHRIPLHRVTTIAVDGDVQLFSVRHDAPSAMPPAYSAASAQPPYSAHLPQPTGPAPGYGAAAYGPSAAGLAPGAYPPQPYYGAQPGSHSFGQPVAPSTSAGYGYGYGQSQPFPVASSGYGSGLPYLHATSAPLPVPGMSPGGRKSPSMLPGIAAGAGGGMLAGAAAYGLSRLMYPHGMGSGHGYKHRGMKGMKFKHKYHKPKFQKFHKHKGFKHKFKGGKHGGWRSSSSSSSEESE